MKPQYKGGIGGHALFSPLFLGWEPLAGFDSGEYFNERENLTLENMDITGIKRAFYATDNYFWLAPGESKDITINVLWREPTDNKKVTMEIGAWNTKKNIVKLDNLK